VPVEAALPDADRRPETARRRLGSRSHNHTPNVNPTNTPPSVNSYVSTNTSSRSPPERAMEAAQ
jgi:hypothetical protein